MKSSSTSKQFSSKGEHKKLRAVSLPSATPEMDKNISDYIDYLLAKKEQEKKEQYPPNS